MQWSRSWRHADYDMTLRALIVDDNLEFLACARRLLERQGIAIVAVATTSAEALRRTGEYQPDVVLVDVDLGEESGIDLAERLAAAPGALPPVVLISAHPEEDLADLIEASPAIGFVSKSELSGRAILEILTRGGGRGTRSS
jgi:two-component system nitrate/nitrite response regulator NarL